MSVKWDTGENDRLPCGCPADYHMADCPLITERFADAEPPEPDEYDRPEYDDRD